MIANELIKKIRKIEIYTSRLVNDQLAGAYHSVFKGRGMAFEEVRLYQPGDDIRLIDWNVTARNPTGEAFIKLFVEERELTVMLLVDMSASGIFGTYAQSKRDIAAEMAAIVAFSAIKNNDRVGLIIFTDEVEKFVPPKKGKKHVLRVITEILNYQPKSKRTNIATGIEFLSRVAKRRTVAFLLTDFLSVPRSTNPDPLRDAVDPDLDRALRIASRKHDLIPVTISDPLEELFPSLGLLNLTDCESDLVYTFDSSGPEARAYATYVRRAKEAREVLFRRLKLDFINVRTDRPYVAAMIEFFRARERRQRR